MAQAITIEQLLETIRAFYSDTSRPRDQTRAGLEEAQEEIELLLNALPLNEG
ncbi:TPA: hypothetical protein L4R50_000205 [Pseudomonas aeruginosa]|nr:hypothetical protein [Pseudomonas aeruginosa]HBP1602112.1 hypothetical protein [Pseudomonas aeruginosa]